MPTYVEREWAPVDAGHLSRKDRTHGTYRAFVPDELGPLAPEVSAAAREAAEDAFATLARVDERIGVSGRYLNHLLIRSEAISSSWIEGNRVTPKRLAIAELLHHGPLVALEVVANVRATEEAIDRLADPDCEIVTADIEHLQHVIEPDLPRGLRAEQNWVGGPGWSPLRADFVPPPETEVPRLVADLARFLTSTRGNPVIRAAVAHAQFETIHPFVDGNGRTGRALIHTVLRRADAARNVLLPISTVFAGKPEDYIAGLTAFRESRLDDWVIGFSRATQLAAGNALRLAEAAAGLQVRLAEQLVEFRRAQGLSPVQPRRDSVVLKVLDALAVEPVVTAESVAQRFDVSTVAAHRALTELAAAEIVRRNKDVKGRLVCWSADDYLDLVAFTERSNRVGGGDTRERRPRVGPPRPHLV